MNKRLVSWVLALSVLLSVLPAGFAAEVQASTPTYNSQTGYY